MKLTVQKIKEKRLLLKEMLLDYHFFYYFLSSLLPSFILALFSFTDVEWLLSRNKIDFRQYSLHFPLITKKRKKIFINSAYKIQFPSLYKNMSQNIELAFIDMMCAKQKNIEFQIFDNFQLIQKSREGGKQMLTNSVIQLLNDTLNPRVASQAMASLSNLRQQEGFVTQLLIIADKKENQMEIRQASLVVLKNLIYDECTDGNVMRDKDIEIVKQSILDALIRATGQKQLTPTMRQIIHLLAEKDYPDRWPDIIPAILHNIIAMEDFRCVFSSVEALKAIVSVCGESVVHEITLNNLCNKIMEPLFMLTGKLFANYSEQTLPILVSVFKIFHISMFFYIPSIVANNIHSLMIFEKKILELPADLPQLKTICLKILHRLYSKHASSYVRFNQIQFADAFHQRYSTALLDTFLFILMSPASTIQMINLSVTCICTIHKNHQKTAQIINSHRDKLIQICLQRYRINRSIKNNKVFEFIHVIEEERTSLIQLVNCFLGENSSVLGLLIDRLGSVDLKGKQVILYIYGGVAKSIEEDSGLYGNMVEFLVGYVLPLLHADNPEIIRARACQILTQYAYLALPESHLKDIFQGVYACLMESKDTYLNVFAIEAFSHLLAKYQLFLGFVVPYLGDILHIYTTLLKEADGDTQTILRSLEELVGKIDGRDLQPYANNLLKFLYDLFYEYYKHPPQLLPHNNDDSTSEAEEEGDENFVNGGRGCLGAIREVLSVDNLSDAFYASIEDSLIFPLMLTILEDKQLLFLEEGLNILNLILFKKKEKVSQNFHSFLPMMLYCFLGIPQQLAYTNITEQHKMMLTNLCVEPDDNMLDNCICVIRNYIVKLGPLLRQLRDATNTTYMQYLFTTVQTVHEGKNKDYSISDRSIVLTIFITFLEHHSLNTMELGEMINKVVGWLNLSLDNKSSQYVPLYLEILMLAIYELGGAVQSILDVEWVVGLVLNWWEKFIWEYQLQRVILGLTKTLDCNMIANQGMAAETVKKLVQFTERIVYLKHQEEENKDEEIVDEEEEAAEDLIEDNTHLGLMPSKQSNEKKLRQEEENEWQQEYNKYYHSPIGEINELEYLTNIIQNRGYGNCLNEAQQQKLTSLIMSLANKN